MKGKRNIGNFSFFVFSRWEKFEHVYSQGEESVKREGLNK